MSTSIAGAGTASAGYGFGVAITGPASCRGRSGPRFMTIFVGVALVMWVNGRELVRRLFGR